MIRLNVDCWIETGEFTLEIPKGEYEKVGGKIKVGDEWYALEDVEWSGGYILN